MRADMQLVCNGRHCFQWILSDIASLVSDQRLLPADAHRSGQQSPFGELLRCQWILMFGQWRRWSLLTDPCFSMPREYMNIHEMQTKSYDQNKQGVLKRTIDFDKSATFTRHLLVDVFNQLHNSGCTAI
jgi:hypothetical protein